LAFAADDINKSDWVLTVLLCRNVSSEPRPIYAYRFADDRFKIYISVEDLPVFHQQRQRWPHRLGARMWSCPKHSIRTGARSIFNALSRKRILVRVAWKQSVLAVFGVMFAILTAYFFTSFRLNEIYLCTIDTFQPPSRYSIFRIDRYQNSSGT
jgi:hypothetical protein